MCDAVAQRVQLETRDKLGISYRESLEQAERQLGQQLFEEPLPPEEGRHLWEWFWELDMHRRANGFGITTIAPVDMLAWALLRGIDIQPIDAHILFQMDIARCAATEKLNQK